MIKRFIESGEFKIIKANIKLGALREYLLSGIQGIRDECERDEYEPTKVLMLRLSVIPPTCKNRGKP